MNAAPVMHSRSLLAGAADARTLASRAAAPSPAAAARQRRGVAAVEFAVCLPVLMLLVFGAIEATSFIFLKQSLHVAAYEGIRQAARSSGTIAEGVAATEAVLRSRQVRDATIQFPSGDVASIPRGGEVVIEVAAPTHSNSPLAGQFVNNRMLTARVVMVKE